MQNSSRTLDGKYEIVEVLGKGGMSTVYLCRNKRLGNLWAIKEIKKEKQNIVSLLAEPNILKNLNHSGIPKVIDVFYENDNMYIVEDYIKGITLKEYVRQKGCLNNTLAKEFVLKLINILSYLHSLNPPIIYRDLKPSNIMVTEDDQVVLIDFGISREYKDEQSEDTVCLGSKGYAAPEQYGHGQSDTHTDIFGLGAVMFYMLTAMSPPSIMTEAAFSNEGIIVEKKLKYIILKCTEIDKNQRFRSVEDIKSKLLESEAEPVDIHQWEHTKILKEESVESSTFDRTILINSDVYEEELNKQRKDKKSEKVEKGERRSKGNVTRKRTEKILLAALIIFIIIVIAGFSTMKSLKNGDAAAANSQNENNKVNDKNSVSQQDIKAKQEVMPLKDDTNIIGGLNLQEPVKVNYGDDQKGKGKEKKEDKSREFNALFKLNPLSVVGKYNNKFTMKVQYLQITESTVIAYCSIENYTGKKISIKYDANTFLLNSKGSSAPIISTASTDISDIPSGTKRDNIKMVFKDIDVTTQSISINTKLLIEDNAYNNNIKLGINVTK